MSSDSPNKADELSRVNDRLDHIYRVLLGIRNVNQLIVTEDDPGSLIERACLNLTETMGYFNAWIALLGGEASQSLGLPRPGGIAASSGFNDGFKVMRERLERGELPACMKQALENAETVVFVDPAAECPDCPLSKHYEGRAALARRMTFDGVTYGILAASVPAGYAQEEEEQDLFNEVAGDLAFALHKITTARKLEESRRRYREIFERSRDGFVMVDTDGRIFEANKAYCEMLGYSLEELRELPDFYAITPERWRKWEKEVIWAKRLLGQGHSGLYEKEYIRKDGTVFPVELRSYLVKTANGDPEYLWGTARDISERKQAEEELQKTESELSTIYNNAPVMICMVDEDRRILYANPAFSEFIGTDKPTSIGERACGVFGCVNANQDPRGCGYGDECQECRILDGILDSLHSGDTHKNNEKEMLLEQDGEQRKVWLLASTSSVQRSDGPAVLLCMQDITEHKRAEEELNKSERRFKNLFESTASGCCIDELIYENGRAVDYRILDVNHSYEKIMGISKSKAIGALGSKLYGAGEAPFLSLLTEVAETGNPVRFESYFEPIQKYLEFTVSNPAEGLFSTVFYDITERVQAEEELHASEQTAHALLNATPDAAFLIDTAGTVLAANEELARRLKQERQAILGKTIYSLLPAEVAARRKEWVDQVVRTGEALTKEDERQGRMILHSLNPVLDAAGCVSAVAVFGQDITERKMAEDAQEQLRNQLSQAQKMESVGGLAGGVAHDFNNMLNVILGYSEMVLKDLPADSLWRSSLEEIRKAAERSANLTQQLLAFARKQTISPRILDLNETISSLIRMLERLIGEDIDMLWKPGEGMAPVLIDPGQVHQTLANLAVNACDAIGHANGKVTIETSSASFDEDYCADHRGSIPGDYVMLAVSDNGCGMDKELLSHIFEPFFTTKDKGQGTGLGLATIYGIVKQNEGFINVYSEPGEGTTVRIYLPALESESPKDFDSSMAAATPAGGQETILIVEDEEAILKLARTMLERLGYTVLTAATPGEAVRTARKRSGELDLVITDVVMPEMNGRDLTRRLQEYCPDIRVLFMSGYTANVISHHGVLDEGVSFIQKPFSTADLAGKIRKTLEK